MTTLDYAREDESEDLLDRLERKRRTAGRGVTARRLLLSAVLFVIAVLMLLPLIWMIVQSLTQPTSSFSLPPSWIPTDFTLDNFTSVFERMPFGRQFMNSRIDFRGSRTLFVVMLSAMMVPGQLVIIPIFILMRQLGLFDSLWAILLPSLINVFQIFFLTQYFRSIPREIDEAAALDGAGHLWILFRLILPLSAPALSALMILSFEASWNNYFMPLIFLSSPENMTLPLGLVALHRGLGAAPAVVVFAALTLVVLPVLVAFLAFQRHFVRSIASTGLKG